MKRKGIIKIIMIILILLFSSIPVMESLTLQYGTRESKHVLTSYEPSHSPLDYYYNISKNSITKTFDFGEPVISNIYVDNHYFTKVTLGNTSLKTLKNDFSIPVKQIQILLPQNSKVSSIELSKITKKTVVSNQLITNDMLLSDGEDEEVIQPVTWSTTKNNESAEIPEENFESFGIGKLRGYTLLMVNVYPIQYNPKENELFFSSPINVTINLEEDNTQNQLYRNYSKDKELILEKIDNPSMIHHYHHESKPSSLPSGTYEYVLITTKELESSFKSFLKYKNEHLTARSVNLSFIESNFQGVDLQEKIREFIKSAYLNWQTEFVLLGGDVSVIPYRGLWGHAVDHNGDVLHDDRIPADIYYAGLDGSWDDDSDLIYGEDAGNSTSEEADFFAEVYVGRAPVENDAEIGTFTNKIITYETSEKPKSILLHQSGLNTRNNPDSTVIPERCAEWIPDSYLVKKLYQTEDTITPSLWMSSFADDNLIVEHTGNGEVDKYYLTWPTHTFSTFEGMSLLENNFFPIHTSVSCTSGAFDEEDCIAETLLLNPYGGASACLFNSRRGFTSLTNVHKYSGELVEQQFRLIFNAGVQHLGEAYQRSKQFFAPGAASDYAYRWCYYTLNLLGDPEMPVLETRQDYRNPTVFSVDDDYSSDTKGWNVNRFNSITDALSVASDWDIIQVNNGVYSGKITIDKSIQLIGEDKHSTILRGSIVRVFGNRIRISGFKITNDYSVPSLNQLIISNSNYITISDCIISNNNIGMYISNAGNVVIHNNEFMNNVKSVYSVVKNRDIYITDNSFSLKYDTSYGIYSQGYGRLIIKNNSFVSENDFYKFTCGIYSEVNTAIHSNSVKNFNIGIWLNYGEHLIENNVIMNNDHVGLYASLCSVKAYNNSINKNGNYFINYYPDFKPGGIIINGSSEYYCTIRDNTFSDNSGYGVYIEGLMGFKNDVTHNSFFDNARDARFENSLIVWQKNYWGRVRVLPKIIFGFYDIGFIIKIPMFQFDFGPAVS
ncbi:MAG: right-handed parallel beta-helix repeat-containing protein [Candidatus Thermoplasmatota archaeon]|nr:right-handed parallel beta-helix repeat-containing protein [Candidatus Thermoplasmatota archaeon]